MSKKIKTIELDPKMKTCLIIECSDEEFHIRYTGSIDDLNPEDKKSRKHDERLMQLLASDKKAFDLLYRIVEPVRRYYNREAKRKSASATRKS